MVFREVYPECHGIASGMVSECVMSAKMVRKRKGVVYWRFAGGPIMAC